MATPDKSDKNRQPDNDTPAYSSRILRVYLDYLRRHYPDIHPEDIFEPAGIKPAEVDDPGFWYSQVQANLMHARMVTKTGDPQISTAAGRFAARSKSVGKIRQFILAIVTPAVVFRRAEKLHRLMSRGATLKIEPLGPLKTKITASPVAGIDEAPFQCENRLGILEGLAGLLKNRSARVIHTECRHAGGRHCVYMVSWKPSLTFTLKKTKHLVGIGSGLLAAGLFFGLPLQAWGVSVAALAVLSLAVALLSDHFEIQALKTTLEDYAVRIEEPHADSDLMYNNALLVQKLGQETAKVFDLKQYLITVMAVIKTRLGFDRGAILLLNHTSGRIKLEAEFGYNQAEQALLNGAAGHLDQSHPERFAATLLEKRQSILVNDLASVSVKVPSRSVAFARLLGSHSFICVPVIFDDEPLGILLLDHKTLKRNYYQSDVNFLEGIAGQIATSIINIRSFSRLRESEEKFRLVFETSPDAFALNRYDDGTYVDVNEGFLSMTGYTREELLGNSPVDLGIWESSSDRRHVSLEIGRQGNIDRYETRFRLKGNRLIIGQISATIVLFDQQKHVFSITRDITEIRRMEAETKKLEAQVRHSAKMESIGTLAGGISHDFNNLMMGIQGNIEVLMQTAEPTGDIFRRLKNIEQHIASGAQLTRQLLGFAQAGKYDVRATDLNALTSRTTRMFARTKKELTMTLQPAENIWAVEVDQSQIEQVLLNLFVNAWQAMPDGGKISVHLKNSQVNPEKARLLGVLPGPFVLITVTDSGEGMDAETLEKIFDPFFTTKEMGRGTGLGLASAYGILQNHGGSLKVKSRKGCGATFYIYVPASGEKADRAPQRDLPVEKGSGNILLVDDEQMILDVARELLEHLGYSVLTAGSGQAAIELATREHKNIDLVILDLIMPGKGGGETFDDLRVVAPGMKILLSSGYALEGEAAEILDRGCNGFIQKPFTLKDLSAKIRTVMNSGG